MNKKKRITFLLIILCLVSCQQVDATPTSVSTNNYRRITSYWGSSILSTYDGSGKNPKLQFSVINQPIEFEQLLPKLKDREKFSNLDLSNEILIMVEWGMYFSGGVRVEVNNVKISKNQVEITVDTFLPDPKIPEPATFASAFDFIAISRRDIDTNGSVKFILINKNEIISTSTAIINQ